MRVVSAFMILASLSAPLGAQESVPGCAIDGTNGALVSQADPRASLPITVSRWPRDWVSFAFALPDGQVLGVIQHCPTDATLLYAIDAERAPGVEGRLDQMLGSDVPHAFDDFQREVRLSGGRAQIRQSGPGRCACDQSGS